MITFQTFRMTTLCFTLISSHWCSGSRAERNWSCHGPIHLCALPCNSRQTVSLWCQEQELHETTWQCMTVHDGRSGSFMTLYCRKACNHYSSTGQLFQYAADQHINRKHHLFVLPSCPAFIISIFPLSPFWLTPRSKHTDKQNPAAFTNILQFAHTVHTNTFVPYLHAPKHKQWTCWQTVQCLQ